MHYKNNGFTLIELLIVIIILGILAATAVPKFVDLASDSKKSTLETVAGAMHSGSTLVYSQAAIEGKTKGYNSIKIDGVDVPIYDGYPAVTIGGYEKMNEQLQAWLVIDSVAANNAQKSSATFFVDKYTNLRMLAIFFTEDYSQKGLKLKCQITYQNSSTKEPVIRVETDDC